MKAIRDRRDPHNVSALGPSKLRSYLRRLWTKVHQIKCACVGEIAVCSAVFRWRYLVSFRRHSRSSGELVRNRARILLFFWPPTSLWTHSGIDWKLFCLICNCELLVHLQTRYNYAAYLIIHSWYIRDAVSKRWSSDRKDGLCVNTFDGVRRSNMTGIHLQTQRWKKAIKLTAWRRDRKTMRRQGEDEMTSRLIIRRPDAAADVPVPSVIVFKSDGRTDGRTGWADRTDCLWVAAAGSSPRRSLLSLIEFRIIFKSFSSCCCCCICPTDSRYCLPAAIVALALASLHLANYSICRHFSSKSRLHTR